MTRHATGVFDVKRTPQTAADAPVGRFSLDKVFRGGLEATSVGEMLAVGSDTPGSAAYVALERVSGTLDGRTGAFALHHVGRMERGAPSLTIEVAPDSGTGELVGLTGRLSIRIEDGQHFYDFEYDLG
ncbi:MAG: DUF3224 domain-containing protein [Kiloniellales bacterium]|nr:DUF3224 domain-containing protein [Caulobacteraceae bacterium]